MPRYWTSVCCAVALACLSPAWSADDKVPADVQFRKAYEVLEQADESRDSGRTRQAITLYKQALTDYVGLAQRYPDWQPGMVGFRIVYSNDQLKALTRRAGPAAGLTFGTSELVTVMPAGPAVPAADQNTVDPLSAILITAKRLLKTGEAARARVILLQGLRLDPDHVTTRVLLGMAQCMARNFADAVFLLQQLVQEIPNDPHARVALATAYFGVNRVADAARELERAIEVAPDMSEAHYNMAHVLLATTPPDTDAARRHYRKSLDLGGAPDEYLEDALK